MTRINSLSLSHFRSHREQRLVFDGRPVAIHGPNGAGKTNLIEAVSLLSPGRGLRGAAAEDLVRRPERIGWKIAANLSGHEVETWAVPGQSREVRIDGKSAPQVALARLGGLLWLVPAMDRLWIEGAEGRRRFLDRITMSFVPDHAGAVLDHDRAMRDRNRLLKDMVRDGHWYAALEAQMGRAGAQMTANRRAAIAALMAAQSSVLSAFPAASLALIHAEVDPPDDAEGLAAMLAANRSRDMAAGRALIGPHRADLSALWEDRGMAAADCSTGEQKALLISLILANARAIAARDGAPPLLLLDEVAAHLDAGRRAALYDEICALGAQAIMTGTGPELFVDLRDRAQHLYATEVAGVSAITEGPAP